MENDMTGSDNGIRDALRDAYWAKKHRHISLPDANHFRISQNSGTVRLSLSSQAVVRNMQNDTAAFEAWLLALKAWVGIEDAVLNWDAPEDARNGHYQRFLYRVSRFSKLYSNWFRAAPESLSHLNESMVKGKLVCNVATTSPNDSPNKASRESRLEKHLAKTGWLANTFSLNPDLVGRQFPVGLFQGKVSRDTNIFTGGKSAIDLVGIEDQPKRLWVFELKADGNQSMGIVSELFFYVSFMRDVIDGKFSFQKTESPRIEGRLHHDCLAGIKEIRGCLLAPKLHPLLDDNLVVCELNKACWPKGVNVDFCSEKIPDALVSLVAT